tara:strand:+ start:4452 stop:4769 length:318 start_codon:yes stop_codon:yes gene_type:complete
VDNPRIELNRCLFLQPTEAKHHVDFPAVLVAFKSLVRIRLRRPASEEWPHPFQGLLSRLSFRRFGNGRLSNDKTEHRQNDNRDDFRFHFDRGTSERLPPYPHLDK